MRATIALVALLSLAACSSGSTPAGDGGAVPADAWMPAPVTCVEDVPTCPDGMDPLCWDQVQRPPTWRCDEITGMCIWRSYAGTALVGIYCLGDEPVCPDGDEHGCLARPAGE